MSAEAMHSVAPAHDIEPQRALALGKRVLATEAAAISALEGRLGASFLAAARALFNCRGRVVVTGIGKSGHIARKLAATLASTGTPAFFVHAAEASHGDLGMITADDVVLLLSNSGETDELVTLVPHLKRQGARLIALTGNEQSSLAFAADVHLDASVDTEAGPLGLAPTASTTAALALGDALALTLLDARGFSVEDFARAHPGGSLGRRLLTHVRDVMRRGADVPAVPLAATLADAVVEMSGKGMGWLGGSGIVVAWITGSGALAVARRAATLGISRVVQGVENKLEAWELLRTELALEPEECAHIGDDFPDLPVIVRCGLAATVPHAPEPLQRRAHYVTRAEGGAGAVRELAALILTAQGKLADLLRGYGDED